MPKRLRVFLDTSALLAGLNSPNGAAGTILAACFAEKIIPVISEQVIEESEENIYKKFPKLTDSWASFALVPPEVVPQPSIRSIQKAYIILSTSDASILAAAVEAKVDALVTWDYDFFKDRIQEQITFPIVLPKDFLAQFLK